MMLGDTKNDHFSCFHSSCQLGLRGKESATKPTLKYSINLFRLGFGGGLMGSVVGPFEV